MKTTTIMKISEALTEDLKAAEKSVKMITSSIEKTDPKGKTYGTLLKLREKSLYRVQTLRDALDDFKNQEW